MNSILLVYSTVDGHTRLISHKIADVLTTTGCRVTVQSVTEISPTTLTQYDKYVVGASIRYGNYRPDLRRFVKSHASILNSKPSAFFSVNLVARKSGRDTPETNPYIKKLLSASPWHPDDIAVFAGKLDYSRCGPLDKQIIRLIMWLTDGPADLQTRRVYTNWEKVEDFAFRVAALSRA